MKTRTLTLAAVSMAGLATACDDAPTTSPNPNTGQRPLLAKAVKPAPASIAFSLNGPDGQNLFVTDTTGTRLEQLTFGGLDDNPAWSPDRRKIAFVRGDGVDQKIYIKALNGGRETLVGPGYEPSWSPDGKQIAFSWWVGGNRDIHVMNVDGSNVRRLTTDTAADAEPHWSPDGLSIVFTSFRTGTGEVFVMKPDGSAQMQRTFCGPSYYCISPKLAPSIGDFRLAFYQGTNSNSGAPLVSAIKIMNSNSDIVFFLDGGSLLLGKPTWSPDAKRVAFVARFSGQALPVLYTAALDGSGFNHYPENVGSAVGAPAWAR